MQLILQKYRSYILRIEWLNMVVLFVLKQKRHFRGFRQNNWITNCLYGNFFGLYYFSLKICAKWNFLYPFEKELKLDSDIKSFLAEICHTKDVCINKKWLISFEETSDYSWILELYSDQHLKNFFLLSGYDIYSHEKEQKLKKILFPRKFSLSKKKTEKKKIPEHKFKTTPAVAEEKQNPLCTKKSLFTQQHVKYTRREKKQALPYYCSISTIWKYGPK